VGVGEDLLARGLKATELIKPLAAEIKGGGGGQPFYATAGGKDPDGLPRALKKARELMVKASPQTGAGESRKHPTFSLTQGLRLETLRHQASPR
jgi:hypothetical protein